YVLGGSSVARGLLDFFIYPSYGDSSTTLAHMPMGTLDEATAKLSYGEAELERLADRTATARILDGSLSLAAGLAIVPLYLVPRDFDVNTLGAVVLIGAGISVIAGVFTL